MRRLVATLVVVAMAAVGVSCGSHDEPEAGGDDVSTQEARFGGTVVFGTTGESSGWLPYTDRWGPGPLTIARALFDPLVSWGTDGKVHPYLAEAFEPNEDYSVWDIVMRPDVKFHNGEDVSGHALVLYLQKARAAPLTIFAMQPIVDIQKVEGDDLRARVFLDQPWPSFPVVFSSQAGFLAAPSQINSEDSQNAIGSGPFEQFSWTPDAELVAKRFDNYWRSDDQGRKLPYLDEVRFRPVPDETTRLASLRTGDLDITQTNAPSTVAGFLSDPSTVPAGINVLTDASESDEFHAVLNTQTGPFTDPRLRKAVQLATDRQAISDAYDSIFKIADGPMSQDSEWWSDSGWPAPDMEAAKALIAEYQADNPGPVQVQMMVVASPHNVEMAQRLEQFWAEAGIEVSIQNVEEQAFADRMLTGDFDALISQFWNGADPDSNYYFWTGDNIGPEGSIGLNFPRWSNETVDAALNTAREAASAAERKEAYATVWREWAEHVPYLWIYHSLWIVLYRDRVHGLDTLGFPDGREMEPVTWGAVFLTAAWVTS